MCATMPSSIVLNHTIRGPVKDVVHIGSNAHLDCEHLNIHLEEWDSRRALRWERPRTNLEEKAWWLEQWEWMKVKGDKAQRYFWGSHWSFHPRSIVVTWFGAGRELEGNKWFTSRKTWDVTEDIQFNSSKHHSAGEILHLHSDFQLLSYSIMWGHLCLLLWEQSTYIYFQRLAGQLTTPCDSLQTPVP